LWPICLVVKDKPVYDAVVNGSILLAHPDPGELRPLLRRAGHRVRTARRLRDIWQRLDESTPDLLVLATGLEDSEGLDALEAVHDRRPDLPVLVLAGPGHDQTAALALRRGAADSLRTPCPDAELTARVERLLASSPVAAEEVGAQAIMGPDGVPRPLFCRSPTMRRAVGTLNRIAATRTTVLLLGESGVGKELFARAIHFNSPRRAQAWVPLNCTAIPETMIESELFGHEKGAFTGAVSRTPGKFELAHRGTIFLDEIGDMTPSAQVKLLRILEDRQLMRVGGTRPVPVDVRLLAATNSDLEARTHRGEFREDLYYRLNVVTLRIPSLRERREDLPELIDHFMEHAIRINHAPARRLHPEARSLLLQYHWPGNVRELKNLMESLVLTAPGVEVGPEDLPDRIRPVGPAPEDGELHPGLSLKEAERRLIRITLEHAGGSRARSAAMLGIGVRTLQRKVRRYGLESAGRRREARSGGHT
jgi:DNA-binding NtrC family response regulator